MVTGIPEDQCGPRYARQWSEPRLTVEVVPHWPIPFLHFHPMLIAALLAVTQTRSGADRSLHPLVRRGVGISTGTMIVPFAACAGAGAA